jgi:dihydroneopterin triphosphate diphosphatase
MTRIASLYVEIVVYKFENNSPKYLILKRSDNEKIFPGIHQIITGTIERSENPIQTAVREMYEETRLAPVKFWFVPFVNSYFVKIKNIINHSPVFLAEVKETAIPVLSSEHQTFGWLNFEAAEKKLTWPNQRVVLKIVENFLVGKDSWGEHTRIELP